MSNLYFVVHNVMSRNVMEGYLHEDVQYKYNGQRCHYNRSHRVEIKTLKGTISLDERSILPLTTDGSIGVITRRHASALINELEDKCTKRAIISDIAASLGITKATVSNWAKKVKPVLISSYTRKQILGQIEY